MLTRIARRSFCTPNAPKNVFEMFKADLKKYTSMGPNIPIIKKIKNAYEEDRKVFGEEKLRTEIYSTIGSMTGVAVSIPCIIALDMNIIPTITLGVPAAIAFGTLGMLIGDTSADYRNTFPKNTHVSKFSGMIGYSILACGVASGIYMYMQPDKTISIHL